jgi:RNA polymerase sigma-70 factor (ECF subfamily)
LTARGPRRGKPEIGVLADDRRAAEVTAAIAGGDPEAFAVLYRAWFDRAYVLARSITRRDESFCLDVVQDAMLRAVRSLPSLPGAEALNRWMARVVQTTAIDRLRMEARRVRREERSGRAPRGGVAADPAAALAGEEEAAWLRRELEKLPAAERLLLHERFERGKSLDEAGRAAGLTGNAASGRIRRILSRLRKAAGGMFRE